MDASAAPPSTARGRPAKVVGGEQARGSLGNLYLGPSISIRGPGPGGSAGTVFFPAHRKR